jgi:hypothetical protein
MKFHRGGAETLRKQKIKKQGMQERQERQSNEDSQKFVPGFLASL